ncbi:hypothetical protein [Roseofilum casamattae]|uniref:Uncharacterized protein n=1 Tax=Roseofilum casamattae BLCC-M143 TaxID=3022442 RepID=A0ABT7BTY0_9CYAN|nr:hypothetical protein [Roseofilum casamattae]MDJ1182640.1 hypothetical protein [Roseofilum casamattae BLCC-M143]
MRSPTRLYCDTWFDCAQYTHVVWWAIAQFNADERSTKLTLI